MVVTRQLKGGGAGAKRADWVVVCRGQSHWKRGAKERLKERPHLVQSGWRVCVCVHECDVHTRVCFPATCSATQNHI